MLVMFPIIKAKQLLRKSFMTVSLHLLHSKNGTQHRRCEGSDRNLFLCKIPSLGLDSYTDDDEEPDGNSERKIFWKTRRRQTTWEVREWGGVWGKNHLSEWVIKCSTGAELSHVTLKVSISPFFSGCFWFSLIYLRFNQKCINPATCSHIHRQCHPN